MMFILLRMQQNDEAVGEIQAESFTIQFSFNLLAPELFF